MSIVSVDAWSVLPMNSRPMLRAGGGESAGRDGAEERGSRRADPVRDQLKAVRRSLWILGAKLECLPAKIERTCRKNELPAGGDGPERPRHAGNKRLAPNPERALGGWLVRWKLARLQARANRAERRSAAALSDASASFTAALDAVLYAAVARVRADAASRGPCRARAARSRHPWEAWEFLQGRATSERNFS